jgi:DNA-directed RNA polymerase specialized sigma24 family protein
MNQLRNQPRNNLAICGCLALVWGAWANSNLLISTAAVEFESRFCPFVNRIYRSALIVAKSPSGAKQLVREICQKAWQSYQQQKPAAEFSRWLAKLMHQSFSQ